MTPGSWTWLVALWAFALIACCQGSDNVPSLTVSGISSGAYMAVQFHIAHSSIVGGAGVVAGGPYWCAQDDAAVALSACMRDPSLISLNELWAATDYAEALASIDSTKHLMGSRVLLFSGQQDTVVAPGVMQKLEEYYGHYLDTRDMLPLFNFSCVHGMVTLDYGLPCATFGSPFLNNCSYDLAGAILQQVYGNTLQQPRAPALASNLVSLQQAAYVPAHDPSLLTSLGPLAYVYYPSACSRQPSNCSCSLCSTLATTAGPSRTTLWCCIRRCSATTW